MPVSLEGKFVVGISSSALFNTKQADKIFKKLGKQAFVAHQIAREEEPFQEGTAFSLIKALLQLNPPQTEEEKKHHDKQLVEVIIFSHTEPAAALRAMNSLEYYQLPIIRAAFVGGAPLVPYLPPYQVSLFLSKDDADVRAALELKIPAAILHDPPETCTIDSSQLRIAFDGDAVIFDDEAEKIYNEQGPKAFFKHESEKAKNPLKAGPFAPFLIWLNKIKKMRLTHLRNEDPVRIAIVTARNSPAHKRVLLTLRAWGIEVDEIFFQGGLEKKDILRAFAPHIFFDDQVGHTKPASSAVPAAHVPFGTKNHLRLPAPVNVIVPPPPEETPMESPIISVELQQIKIAPISEEAFEQACRAIFRSYTPMASTKKSVILAPRFRDFIAQNKKKKSPEQRAHIIKTLSRYDLNDILTHEPMLNREIEEMVARKLAQISGDSSEQQDLDFKKE